MMLEPAQNDQVVICAETFPVNYEVTQDEIQFYAKQIDINLDTEKHLVPVIINALSQPLPKDWIPCYDRTQQTYFYFNLKSGVSQWEHPIDQYYRALIEKLRSSNTAELNENSNKETDGSDCTTLVTQEMLPLRQNRKPQLMPIKELLKYKDSEKQFSDEEKNIDEYMAPFKLKSSSNFKKLVKFDEDKPKTFSEKKLFNTESEKSDKLDFEIPNSFKRNKELLSNIYSHYQHSIEEDSEHHETGYLKDKLPNRKPTQSILSGTSQNRPKSALRSRNFKRLQINLQPPERILLSDNNDDTIRNIYSDSASSELVSDDEEEETPHNILTNVTESGIDVNTVTDLQKLKAKGILGNQNNNSDLDKKILNTVNGFLNDAITKMEQNLVVKFETKIDNEIIKLKKHQQKADLNSNNGITSQDKQNMFRDLLNESQTRLDPLQKKLEEQLNFINEFQTKHNAEMKKLEDRMVKRFTTEFEKKGANDNLNDLRASIHKYAEEKLRSIEQNLTKKVDNLEIKHKSEVDRFKLEKEQLLSEQHKKFQSFLEEYGKSEEGIREETVKIVQNEINNLLTARESKLTEDNPLLLLVKKMVLEVLKTDTSIVKESSNGSTIDMNSRSIAIQTEDPAIKVQFEDIKGKVEDLLNIMRHLPNEESPDKLEKPNISVLRLAPEESRSSKIFNKDVYGLSSIHLDSSSADLNLENSTSIDKELEHYRRKYLQNWKWLMQRKNESKMNPRFKVFQ